MANFGRKEGMSHGWEDNNIYQHVKNNKLGRQHTKAPLAAALSPFMSLLYPLNPYCERCVNDVWRLAKPPRSTSCTLFEQWCGFFYVPNEPDKWKCCETGPTRFCPYPRRLESLTVRRCRFKGSTFFSVILGPWVLVRWAECWSADGSRDLPLSRPALSQLS